MRRFCGDCLSANFSEVGTGLGDIGIFDWLFFYDFRARPPAGGRGLSANSSEVGTGLVEIGIVDQLFFYDFRARPPAGGRRPPGRKATGLGGERPRREGVQGPCWCEGPESPREWRRGASVVASIPAMRTAAGAGATSVEAAPRSLFRAPRTASPAGTRSPRTMA